MGSKEKWLHIHDMLEDHGGVAKYSGAYGRLRVSRRHLDESLSTAIISVQSFDRDEKLSRGEIGLDKGYEEFAKLPIILPTIQWEESIFVH